MEKTWNFIWNHLYDERTGMFYNHLAGDAKKASQYLPEPAMIAALIPNPGGYGTGMEDCMLNAGLMMDAVIARYEASGEESMGEYADSICRGLILDATVSPQRGFLPRGVSPEDCRSHYIDTSRDQYTNWFYAAYRLYYSPLCSEKRKEEIRGCLTAFAEKFEAEITEENDWNFLREDGRIGVVGKMWGDIHPHEYLRLPMLYLLTWKTTGEEHWRSKYLEYRDCAVEKSCDYNPFSEPSYATLQMQFSMRLVYDLDDDPQVRGALLEIMRKLAEIYEKAAVRQAEDLMKPERKEWLEIPYKLWQASKFRYAGVYGNMGYFVPEPSDFREHQSYYPLRAVGEGISIAAVCPGWKVSADSVSRLCEMADYVDYEKHRTCAPIALLEAYWLTQRNN